VFPTCSLVLSKFEWAKLAVSERQIADVVGILRTQGDDLDQAYIERWVAALGLDAQWNKARADAGLTTR
jgi:hypothetical protein